LPIDGLFLLTSFSNLEIQSHHNIQGSAQGKARKLVWGIIKPYPVIVIDGVLLVENIPQGSANFGIESMYQFKLIDGGHINAQVVL
jgi:hypothetical protein